jgi:hypothetical protein
MLRKTPTLKIARSSPRNSVFIGHASNPPTSSTISSPDNSFSLSASAILSTNFNCFTTIIIAQYSLYLSLKLKKRSEKAADIYQHREFDNWRKTINPRNIHEFEERVGPVWNFDTSATALNYFQCFYTEEVFETIQV